MTIKLYWEIIIMIPSKYSSEPNEDEKTIPLTNTKSLDSEE